jgi:hypothetical protein
LLQNDLERYSTGKKPIKKPNLIVVSGDLVQGLTEKESLGNIKQQYIEANNLLSLLATLFLSGDKNKVIIVPGNHDVCWYYSRKSMKNVQLAKNGTNEKRKLVRELVEENSNIRWSWDSCEFFRVDNPVVYQKAFKPFSDFYGNFYDRTRNYSLDPSKQFDIFDYPDLNTTVATYNSCYTNDNCNSIGRIHPDCISGSIHQLMSPRYQGRFLIAVWHHYVRGLPTKPDFLDSRCLRNLIEYGFSIGFHGHQHAAGVVEEHLNLLTGAKSYFVGAGTLCGGKNELPVGIHRQYNIVQINQTSMEATIHIREMKESPFELPIWGAAAMGVDNISKVDVTLQKRDVRIKRENEMDPQFKQIIQAEKHIGSREYREALLILDGLGDENEFVRRFKIECYLQLGDNHGLAKLCFPPKNDADILICLDALWHEDMMTEINVVLSDNAVIKSTNKDIQQAIIKYKKKLQLRRRRSGKN